MIRRTHLTRALAALLLGVLALAFTSCRYHTDYEIKDENNITVKMDMAVSPSDAPPGGKMPTKDEMCQNFKPGDMAGIPNNAKCEGYQDGDKVGARVTATGSLADFTGKDNSFILKHADKRWTFELKGSGSTKEAEQYLKSLTEFRVSVKFPGKVVSSSGPGAKVEGNKVTWTDKAALFEGMKAEAEDANPLMDALPWIIGGLLLLLALGGLAFFLLRKKKTPPAAPAQPYGTPGYDPNAPQGAHGAPGAPAAPFGQPSAPAQPYGQPQQPPYGQPQQPYGQQQPPYGQQQPPYQG